MSEIVVSFCISSYRRCKILKELITEILLVDSNKFDVIVCDDCSSDETLEEIRNIKDERLKIYVNEKNIGGPMNICKSLDHGDGEYLFYLNERDNINSLKIKKLISILEELKEKNVAFARCIDANSLTDYKICESGKDAMLEFACQIVHPTGYIFYRNIWNKISKRSVFFDKEYYGDYGLTLVSAILSKKYNGAWIYGDICDVKRRRIDFSKEKSGYLKKKKDQRMWYSPEVQWRELMIANKLLNKLDVKDEWIDQLLQLRYKEYLDRVVIQFHNILKDPANTIHYNLEVTKNPIVIKIKSLKNGLILWRNMAQFCIKCEKKELYKSINIETIEIYAKYFHI